MSSRRSAGLANRLESSFLATVSPPSALPSSAAILISGSTARATGTGSAPGAQRCKPLGAPMAPTPKKVCAVRSAGSASVNDKAASETEFLSPAAGISGGWSAMKSSSSTDGALSRSASSIARSETLGCSASDSCSTGIDGGTCAGCASGGTLSIASALLSRKMNERTGGCTGTAAGALTGCSCGNTSGATGAAGVCTGRRSPFRRRLTVGYSTGSALVTLSGASICQELVATALGSKLTV